MICQNFENTRVHINVHKFYLMLSGLAVLMTEFVPRLGCLRASKKLHSVLMGGVLHAPLTFFDTTPVGRILQRFGKDIDVLDNSLPQNISDTMYCLFEVNR